MKNNVSTHNLIDSDLLVVPTLFCFCFLFRAWGIDTCMAKQKIVLIQGTMQQTYILNVQSQEFCSYTQIYFDHKSIHCLFLFHCCWGVLCMYFLQQGITHNYKNNINFKKKKLFRFFWRWLLTKNVITDFISIFVA